MVSRHPQVRSILAEEQRRLGGTGAVVEGRDIGTVIFPDADLKLFLDVNPAVRARGGWRSEMRIAELAESLARRDTLDARTNPLEAAPDAVVLDNEGRSPDEVLAEASGRGPRTGGRMSPRRPPLVAVVGRVNVGKSTLVNRLHGRRAAIADDMPGVTRDRFEAPVSWRGHEFTVVDTGGYIPGGSGIDAQVRAQADVAAQDADVILFVVDAETGIQEEDAIIAKRLRTTTKPVILVANKLDAPLPSPADIAGFYKLGLGEPMTLSAVHGYGADDLLDRVLELLPEEPEDEEEPEEDSGEARFAIVGRPNVGKSSLFNRLVGQERTVVHDIAGTTRDAVDSVIDVDGRPVRFVDTAGFRKRTRLQGVEYYGMVRALQAIDRSDVCLVVIDSTEGVTGEDKRILARTEEAGRGIVAVANKWDLIPSEEKEQRLAEIKEDLQVFTGVPVLRTSATRPGRPSDPAGAAAHPRRVDEEGLHQRGQQDPAEGRGGAAPAARPAAGRCTGRRPAPARRSSSSSTPAPSRPRTAIPGEPPAQGAGPAGRAHPHRLQGAPPEAVTEVTEGFGPSA